jgi:hypothetical protein
MVSRKQGSDRPTATSSLAVIAVADATHGDDQAGLAQPAAERQRGVLPRFKGSSQHRLGDRSVGVR